MQPRLHTLLAAARAAALLLLAGFAISACSSETTAPGQTSTPSIYPLAVGNSWTYKRTLYKKTGEVDLVDTIRMVAERDTLIGSEKWIVLYTRTQDTSSDDYELLSARADGVWNHDKYDDTVRMQYKHPAKVGDRYVSSRLSSGQWTVTDTAAMVTTPKETYRCWVYKDSDGFTNYLAPGVGLVRYEYPFLTGGKLTIDLIAMSLR